MNDNVIISNGSLNKCAVHPHVQHGLQIRASTYNFVKNLLNLTLIHTILGFKMLLPLCMICKVIHFDVYIP